MDFAKQILRCVSVVRPGGQVLADLEHSAFHRGKSFKIYETTKSRDLYPANAAFSCTRTFYATGTTEKVQQWARSTSATRLHARQPGYGYETILVELQLRYWHEVRKRPGY